MASNHVKRALLAAVIAGAVVSVLLAVPALSGPPSKLATDGELLLASSVVAAVAAVIAGAATFVVSRFEVGRRSAWVALFICVLISVAGGAQQPTWAERLDPSAHAQLWLIVWPIAFAVALWSEVRWALGRAVYARLFRPAPPATLTAPGSSVPPPMPAAAPSGLPTTLPSPVLRGALAPSPPPPRR